MRKLFGIVSFVCLLSCNPGDRKNNPVINKKQFEILRLTMKDADSLAEIPCRCLIKEYPYRLGQTLGSEADLGSPRKLHPAFYGCTSWNSSVLGFLALTKLLKKFPAMQKADSIRILLADRLSVENIQGEVVYFQNRYSKSFQRTAGWNSLLQLSKEFHNWNDALAKKLEKNLQPLTGLIVANYLEFLPKLEYASVNTAAGLSIAYDYAVNTGEDSLKNMIERRAKDFYLDDIDYKFSYELSEEDPVSIGLQEVDIMRRILPKEEFRIWLSKFLPALADKNFLLEPVKDTTTKKTGTGKRKGITDSADAQSQTDSTRRTAEPEIHPDLRDENILLPDRLNLIRAFCLIGIADDLPEYEHLRSIAYEHVISSLPNVLVKTETKLKLLQMMFWYQ